MVPISFLNLLDSIGSVPDVEMATMIDSFFTMDGTMKSHKAGSSTTLTGICKDKASVFMTLFISLLLVAAKTSIALSMSPFLYSLGTISILPFFCKFERFFVNRGLITFTFVLNLSSILTFCSATDPPPITKQSLSATLKKIGQ